MKAIIITIGDEILIGQIIDSNSAWIASQLQDLNIKVTKIESISDDHHTIKDALKRACNEVDLIITTGGLGPTKDDITKIAIADFLGLDSYFDQGVYDNLVAMFARFGRTPNEAHKHQAEMPKGVKLLENKMGTAPGMLFEHKGTTIVSMPGVPYEMKYIFSESLTPLLKEKSGNIAIQHKTIHTAGRGESQIAEQIEPIINQLPENIKIAYLPSLGKVRLRLSGTHQDTDILEKDMQRFTSLIVAELGDLVFGYDDDSLSSVVQKTCIKNQLTLSVAESCTGGNLAKTLLEIPGASAYFLGGIVAYSYQLKGDLLGVKQETLDNFGAVSNETVIEMAKGALKTMNSDIALAISGIAGPGGGTPEKPVGTIYLCCATKDHHELKKLSLSKDRAVNIRYTTNAAMLMILKMAQKYQLV